MNRLRVALVDDEPLARARIRRLLADDPEVVVVGECDSVEALRQLVAETRIDALFLDIEMPEADGFSAVSVLPEPRPQIVFVTAYSEYAAQAFDIEATDYLVKPIAQARLNDAVARLRARRATAMPTAPPLPATAYPERLPLPIGRRIQLVEVSAIDRVLAQANYLEVRSGGRSYVMRRSLASLEKQLDPARFIRVHRSHIVRVDAVAQIEAQPFGRYRLTLKDGTRLHSGRSHRTRVRAAFGLEAIDD